MEFKSGKCKSCEHRDQFIKMYLEKLYSGEKPVKKIYPCSNCDGEFYFIPEDKEDSYFLMEMNNL